MAALAAAVSLVVVTGCVADPPPPTVVGGGEEGSGSAQDVSLDAGGLLLALDRVEEGFNPHLLADQGVDTDLVASLLLPSAFVTGPRGEPVLNDDLLVSAAPLTDAPSTIRYTIDPGAQWSDGVPVAAEDFEYLWRQMTTQPGVVDPAGYERIVAVRAGAGGKVVDVVFDAPPEHWRSLFTHLLPGHILKDAPDGFEGAMSGLPVMSAGPYMIRAADLGRGEIEFVRNDRYWAKAPAIGQIVVRRETGPGQLGTALRDGPGVVAMVADTPVAADVAATVPGVAGSTVMASAQLELGFNTEAPAVSQENVRRALAATIDPDVVGRIVTGEADPRVSSFPFPAGAAAVTTSDSDLAESELAAAGYSRQDGWWQRSGELLTVTLGVEAADDRAATAAYTLADQLRGAGIGAQVWELEPTALYADALPHGLVDAVVGWQPTDGNPELAAVSRFACTDSPAASADTSSTPSRPPTTVSSLVPPTSQRTAPSRTERDTAQGEEADDETTPTSTETTPARTLGARAQARTSDVAGHCDPRIDAALGFGPNAGTNVEGSDGAGARAGAGADTDGEAPRGTAHLTTAGDLVSELALRVPLVRPTMLLADDGLEMGGPPAAEDDTDVSVARTVTDVFEAAPTWRRNG